MLATRSTSEAKIPQGICFPSSLHPTIFPARLRGYPLRTPCTPRLKSADVVIVVTVFTQRQRVRIISARYATKKEEKRYWAKRFGY